MANVLDREKQQQLLALGRLGWTLRRIEQETEVRRGAVSAGLDTERVNDDVNPRVPPEVRIDCERDGTVRRKAHIPTGGSPFGFGSPREPHLAYTARFGG